MDTFNKKDKVLKIGTASPIMKIKGKLVTVGLPEYSETDDVWTCEWTENTVFHRVDNFKESELELFIETEETQDSEGEID